MHLNPNSWHVKWFFLSTTLFEAWKDSPFPPEFDGVIHSNICPYLRRLLITFPMLLAFYGAVAWVVIYALVLYPALHIGWGFFITIGAAILIVASSVLAIWGLIKVFPRILIVFAKYIGDPIARFFYYVSDRVEDCILGEPDAPSFCAVLRQWIIDRHHQICRPITIGHDEDSTP